jgi:DNA-binding NtrC family response regulator
MSAARRTIALVDDDLVYLEVMRQLLEDEGYDVLSCSDWREAYRNIKATPPDLLILDIRMHGAPDWYVFDEVIADTELARIPRIVCSALVPDLRWTDPSVAASRYHPLPKPFDLDELLGLVHKLLSV